VAKLVRDGEALSYEEAGIGGPPFVLVGDADPSFAAQVGDYRGWHRVVAVDLRDFGTAGPARAVEQLADDLAWLCVEIGLDRSVVIGQGRGRLVALELAARRPDLVAAVVPSDSPVATLDWILRATEPGSPTHKEGVR
jgi:pimeloyl-ACP methyl ester carboxylesterase